MLADPLKQAHRSARQLLHIRGDLSHVLECNVRTHDARRVQVLQLARKLPQGDVGAMATALGGGAPTAGVVSLAQMTQQQQRQLAASARHGAGTQGISTDDLDEGDLC
jgi:cell division inhibitor SulA